LERLAGLFAGGLWGEDTDLFSVNVGLVGQRADKDKNPCHTGHTGRHYTDSFLLTSTKGAMPMVL
jgi:hypothetical protein